MLRLTYQSDERFQTFGGVIVAKKIDWMYARRSCETCKKANAYLEGIEVVPTEVVDALKVRFGDAEALSLLDGLDKLVTVKGKKIEVISLKKDRPADAELLTKMMGPTGNLRAPTAIVGKTLLVGFNPESYEQVIG
jgi:arsenate reductase-like glutaredoxin family protein